MKYNRDNLTNITQAMNKIFLFLLMFCFCIFPAAVHAESMVSASYLNAGGNELSVRINIGSPPPASLIFIQRFPPGTDILNAQPQPQKIDRAKGEAKWLFRGLKPGSITVSIALDKAVSPAQLSGQIRFKPPGKNQMETLPVMMP